MQELKGSCVHRSWRGRTWRDSDARCCPTTLFADQFLTFCSQNIQMMTASPISKDRATGTSNPVPRPLLYSPSSIPRLQCTKHTCAAKSSHRPFRDHPSLEIGNSSDDSYSVNIHSKWKNLSSPTIRISTSQVPNFLDESYQDVEEHRLRRRMVQGQEAYVKKH